jgi:hypothetical protein
MNRRSFLAALCAASILPAAKLIADNQEVMPFPFKKGPLICQFTECGALSDLSAKLGNVDISNAYIGTLVVSQSNIEMG